MKIVWLLLIVAVVLLIVYFIRKNFKTPKYGSLCVTTGGLKNW